MRKCKYDAKGAAEERGHILELLGITEGHCLYGLDKKIKLYRNCVHATRLYHFNDYLIVDKDGDIVRITGALQIILGRYDDHYNNKYGAFKQNRPYDDYNHFIQQASQAVFGNADIFKMCLL